jgi:hypothetical protein
VNRTPPEDSLSLVLAQLQRYEHPLVHFSARTVGAEVEVNISLRQAVAGIEPYRFTVHPRDLASPQFAWQFQRQLYDCLHDYLVEMFVRTPQERNEL